MFKVAVLSLLVLGCSALPYQQSGLRYGGYGQQTFLTSQPKISVVGLNSGYSGYGSGLGLSSGFLGAGYGSGYSSYGSGLQLGGIRSAGYGYGSGALLASAPVATQVVAAPVATIAAAPIATTQVLTAAPALQSVQSYGLNSNINLLNVRQGQQFQQVVPAAIQQIARTVEYRTLPNQEQPIQAQVVEVEPSDNPVHLHFKTRSSTLSASQSHIAAGATEVQTAAAQDEPQRLITEVQKPVIQEVKEVISPFRQVTQEINPVVESLHTIVTKGDGQRQQYAGQQLVGQYSSQQYVAPASFQTQTLAAPALQTIAVQAAPAIQTVSAPLQTVAVQAAPVAVETVAVQSAPAIAIQSAPASFQTYTQSAPASFSTFSQGSPSSFSLNLGSSNQKLGYGSSFQSKLVQPISSGSYSSYSSSSSSNGY